MRWLCSALVGGDCWLAVDSDKPSNSPPSSPEEEEEEDESNKQHTRRESLRLQIATNLNVSVCKACRRTTGATGKWPHLEPVPLTWHRDEELDSVSMSVETQLGVGHGAVRHKAALHGEVRSLIPNQRPACVIPSDSGMEMITPFPVPTQSRLQDTTRAVILTKEKPSLPSDGHPDAVSNPGQLPHLALLARMSVKRLLLRQGESVGPTPRGSVNTCSVYIPGWFGSASWSSSPSSPTPAVASVASVASSAVRTLSSAGLVVLDSSTVDHRVDQRVNE
ncbi:hypothetical protein EYF80_032109 [Liparis tanakae]|uniref:Uncharacterized protein n=1 Tax=Liparis tanakae TaxID=230148 RepID=A0A4Z2GVH7_9TELE|nr:hypothetical protein EYF80_032109 [Liparis tanakae]